MLARLGQVMPRLANRCLDTYTAAKVRGGDKCPCVEDNRLAPKFQNAMDLKQVAAMCRALRG